MGLNYRYIESIKLTCDVAITWPIRATDFMLQKIAQYAHIICVYFLKIAGNIPIKLKICKNMPYQSGYYFKGKNIDQSKSTIISKK